MLALGFRKSDIFTTLTVDEMMSIVVAAQPGSAVHHAVNDGFTLTDHLLAGLYEHQAGLGHLPGRIPRPGVGDVRPATPASFNDHTNPIQRIGFDVTTIADFEARRRARGQRA